MPKPVDIKIEDRKGKVNKYECTLHTDQSEEAVWNSDDGRCLVIFGTSPFKDSVFVVPDGGSVSSGEVVAPVEKPPKKYKYTVVGPDGSNDPIIVIDK